MVRYKPYERYKDSGIEWIGKIPEHWDLKKIKHVLLPQKGAVKAGPFGSQLRTDDMIPDGKYKVYTQRNVLEKDAFLGDDYISDQKYLDLVGFAVEVGDVLITSRGTIGRAYAIPNIALPGVLHPCLLRIRLKKCVQIEYLLYLFNETNITQNQVELESNATTIEVIYSETLRNILFTLPALQEQEAITDFLDQKTSEIDGLVADKEKLVSLLQEYRQAIISEAVTKGLNPDVKMKDSGVEWIGEISEHWQVIKLKHLYNINMGQSPSSEEYNLEGYGLPFLQGNAEFGALNPVAKQYCAVSRKIAFPNDILLSVRAPVGAQNIADQMYGIGRGLCAITINTGDTKYFWYLLTVVKTELHLKSTGSTYDAVTVEDVANLSILNPPIDEQQAIADYLDQKTAEIDDLIAGIQESIDQLKSYRQSLISEAVTGKIDVRGVI